MLYIYSEERNKIKADRYVIISKSGFTIKASEFVKEQKDIIIWEGIDLER